MYLQVFLPVFLQVKWRGAKPRTPQECNIQLATPPRESVQVCACVCVCVCMCAVILASIAIRGVLLLERLLGASASWAEADAGSHDVL